MTDNPKPRISMRGGGSPARPESPLRDKTVPRNELRGLEGEPLLYHVWFATKRRKWLLQGDVDARTDNFWQRGFGCRELGDDAWGVAWYI